MAEEEPRLIRSLVNDYSRTFERNLAERLDFSKEHFESHRKALLKAAEQCRQRKLAIVLGAGRCVDVPLRELAEKFERVVLVDLAKELMEKAVEELPANLRGKVEVKTADLSFGATGCFLQHPQKKVGGNSPGIDEHALDNMRAQASEAVRDAGQYPLQEKADFVASAMCLSQLLTYARNHLEEQLGGNSDIPELKASVSGRIDRTMSEIYPEVHDRHLSEINRLLKKDGIGFLSTDVHYRLVAEHGTKRRFYTEEIRDNALQESSLKDFAEKYFTVPKTKARQWLWRVHKNSVKRQVKFNNGTRKIDADVYPVAVVQSVMLRKRRARPTA